MTLFKNDQSYEAQSILKSGHPILILSDHVAVFPGLLSEKVACRLLQQRGTVENIIGLIRQYVSRKDIADPNKLQEIENRLNFRCGNHLYNNILNNSAKLAWVLFPCRGLHGEVKLAGQLWVKEANDIMGLDMYDKMGNPNIEVIRAKTHIFKALTTVLTETVGISEGGS